jgi:hypothetical protein
MIDGDHSRLGGSAGDSLAAWDSIRAEYEALSGGVGYSSTVLLLREIHYLTAKIEIVGRVTDMMALYYVPGFGEILHAYGFRYEWENIAPEQYIEQLQLVVSRSKTWYVQLLAKKKEWDSQINSPSSGPMTRDYFEDWLIGLSKDQGYHLKSTEITTYQFAILIKRSVSAQRKSQKG